MPIPAVVLFDLDGTLLTVNSANLWVKRELRLGRIGYGQFLSDDGGETLGSSFFMQLDDRAAADAFVAGEPMNKAEDDSTKADSASHLTPGNSCGGTK